MTLSRICLSIGALFVAIACLSNEANAWQQGVPDAGFDPGQPAQEPVQDPTQGTDDQTGGNNGEIGDAELESVEPTRLTFDIEDRRNQGFVGGTADRIDPDGFSGTPGERVGPELFEESIRGGNINVGEGQRNATTSSRQLQENGFTVQRRGIRSRLRPAFAAPRLPDYLTEVRFQSRMNRQPIVRQFGQGVTITVSNRTAVLTGVVASNAEREIITRQLRLEPGVYRIEDRTTNAQ